MKGIGAISSLDADNLECPLMALIDYKGFRLTAMSQLPISHETLCLGSGNGGLTIHQSDPTLFARVSRIGATLNLKPHLVGPVEKPVLLPTPVDLEGHRVGDRYYLCDFSRLMPPEKPLESQRQSYLYRLLRPEFVRVYEKPLSSDAYSQFGKNQPSNAEDNSEIDEATLFLHRVTIPMVAANLESVLKTRDDYAIMAFRLSTLLHSQGVNIRHLFRLYECLTFNAAKAVVLIEMTARVVVHDIRRKFRSLTRKLAVSVAESNYLDILNTRLNLVFGNGTKSVGFWNKRIRKRLLEKFCGHLGNRVAYVEKFPMFSTNISFKAATMSFVFHDGMISLHLLFERIRQVLGFKLKPTIERQLEDYSVFARVCCREVPFRRGDFEDLGMRVKHMNIVSFASGFQYFHLGLDARATDPKSAVKWLGLSIKHFEDALAVNTASKVTLLACARALFYFDEEIQRAARIKRSAQASSDGTKSSLSSGTSGTDSAPLKYESAYLARADLYFRSAIMADPDDPDSLYAFGSFLDRLGRKDMAETYYSAAIKSFPGHVDALKGYGDFLSDQGRFQESEVLYLLAREASRQKI